MCRSSSVVAQMDGTVSVLVGGKPTLNCDEGRMQQASLQLYAPSNPAAMKQASLQLSTADPSRKTVLGAGREHLGT